MNNKSLFERPINELMKENLEKSTFIPQNIKFPSISDELNEKEIKECINELKKKTVRREKFIVMWTYEDCFGYNSGYVDIYASNREEAEKIFYEINRPFIIRVENGEPIYNPEGGFVCECVLTYEEWLSEGSPQDLGVQELKLNMLDKFI